MSGNRVNYLDGIRGVAILLVIGYHAFSRWPELVPYGDRFADFPLFSLGWLGVELFFILSGFVIFMTLDRTHSYRQFLYKRWLRLFPALFIATVVIFVTSYWFTERPMGAPNWLSVLPGLTFIEPEWWSEILSAEVTPIEGSFWSIFVEFKFYLIAGLIYFYVGRRHLISLLTIFFVCYMLVTFVLTDVHNLLVDDLRLFSHLLSFHYFGWFACGSCFYLYYQGKDIHLFYRALALGAFSCLSVLDYSIYATIAAFLVCLGFAFSLQIAWMQKILQTRILLFFGFISYTLYLLHENTMIASIIELGHEFPNSPSILLPFVSVSAISLVAWFVAQVGEPALRGYLVEKITLISNKLPLRQKPAKSAQRTLEE